MLLSLRFKGLLTFKSFLRVNVADLRKGDWMKLDDGKTVIVHNLASSHSGRGSRSFLVNFNMPTYKCMHFPYLLYIKLTVKDPSNDSITTIKPMGRDMFERNNYNCLPIQLLLIQSIHTRTIL